MKYLLTALASLTFICQLSAQTPSPESLTKLDQLVQSFVDDDDVVGAELLVVQGGKTLLQGTYGWRDRESETAMEVNSVFCVRSMTKPLIGTSILMLVEDGKLRLEDPIIKYLPYFDVEATRNITIAHLMSHTSGMPMSQIMATDLNAIDGIQEVAKMGANADLLFEPGTSFSYSDQGTDTLTAIIEVVTGSPAEDFVRARILQPLGMEDSACLITRDHPLRDRGCSKYTGGRGGWTRFWSTEQEPLFPFFLGSQGLYSTIPDYARFMQFWKDQGQVQVASLLDSKLMQKALKPGPFHPGFPSDIPGLTVEYGYLMTLWMDNTTKELIAFGHNGSDGTHAWVFPEKDAMVFYFTQSRGTLTGMQVGKVLAEMFLGAEPEEEQVAPPLEQFLGYYWEHDDDSYRAVVEHEGGLAMELHGKGVFALDYLGGDRWQFRQNPSEIITFDRSEGGEVSGFHLGDHKEFRFTPSSELPSVDELASMIAKTHRMDLMETFGPMQSQGEINLKSMNAKGDMTSYYQWPNQYRLDVAMNGETEASVFDGEFSSYEASASPAQRLDGIRAEQIRVDNHFARFGDWHQWHSNMQVIQHLVRGGKDIYLVRAGDALATASTFFVDGKSGRMVGEDKVSLIPGMGYMGMRVRFEDFRDVSGMLLPYKTQIKFANPMIGTVWTTISSIEVGVELPEDVFHLATD